MPDQPQDEAIAFRSQTLAIIVLLSSLSLAVFLAQFFVPVIHKDGCTFLALLMLTPLLGFLGNPGVGAFHIDHEGIKQTAFLRKSRYLRWRDVERIKWHRAVACFEGKGTTIAIRWTMVSKAEAARAKIFLQRILSPYFDLSVQPIRQWSFEANRRSILIWLCKLIGISIAGAALYLGPLAILIFAGVAHWVQVTWFVLFLAGLLAIPFARALKERRRLEQINPTWRLRLKEEPST